MHGTAAQIAVEPRRIYLDDSGEIFCTVSPEDHAWALQWRWHYVFDRRKKKIYARRTTRDRKAGRQYHVWLHKAILTERMGLQPPTEAHTIGEHGNGNSQCNERWNLSWATVSMNRRTARR